MQAITKRVLLKPPVTYVQQEDTAPLQTTMELSVQLATIQRQVGLAVSHAQQVILAIQVSRVVSVPMDFTQQKVLMDAHNALQATIVPTRMRNTNVWKDTTLLQELLHAQNAQLVTIVLAGSSLSAFI